MHRGGRDPGGGFLPGQADQVLVGEQPEQAQDRCVTGACGPVTQRVFQNPAQQNPSVFCYLITGQCWIVLSSPM